MLISTKGRYALRVLIDIAEHHTQERTPLKEIAERQNISQKYKFLISFKSFLLFCFKSREQCSANMYIATTEM